MKNELKRKVVAVVLSLGLVTGMVQGIGTGETFKISTQAATKRQLGGKITGAI